MNELIQITYDGEQPTVSARELHTLLEVNTDYRHWFPRMCEYGFVKNVDFNPVKNDRVQDEGNRTVSRAVDDAQITIAMAKELCMLQRNEKGKQARQYFIQLEKAWNTPEQVMARALKIADRKLQVASEKVVALERIVEEQRPQVLFANSVSAARTSILVGELAKLLKQNGVDIGQNRLFQWLRDNKYLISRKGSDYNMPTQRSMELGLFEIKETSITHADGVIGIGKTPKVTGKGQVYFINKLCANALGMLAVTHGQ